MVYEFINLLITGGAGAKSAKHWIWTFTGKFVSSRALSRAADAVLDSKFVCAFKFLRARPPADARYLYMVTRSKILVVRTSQ